MYNSTSKTDLDNGVNLKGSNYEFYESLIRVFNNVNNKTIIIDRWENLGKKSLIKKRIDKCIKFFEREEEYEICGELLDIKQNF